MKVVVNTTPLVAFSLINSPAVIARFKELEQAEKRKPHQCL
jgi:hypothetical protein